MAGKQVAISETATRKAKPGVREKMAEVRPFMKIPNELARNSWWSAKISTGTRVLRKPLRCYTPTALCYGGAIAILGRLNNAHAGVTSMKRR